MNKNRNRHWTKITIKSVAIAFLALLLSIPFIMNGIYPTGEYSAAWIGFWGSFAGGILGTLGVIYVAYLQNEQQKNSMRTIENHNIKRLRIQTLLELLSDYRNDVDDLLNDVIEIQDHFRDILMTYKVLNYPSLDKLEEVTMKNLDNNDEANMKKIEKIRQQLKNKDIPAAYITTRLGDIEYINIMLSYERVELGKRLSGEQNICFDEIIKHVCSEDFNIFKFVELVETSRKSKDRNFEDIKEWLQLEKAYIYSASSALLQQLRQGEYHK